MGAKLWSQVYTLNYRMVAECKDHHLDECHNLSQSSSTLDKTEAYMQYISFFTSIFNCELASDLDKSSPTDDILFMLKILEGLNRFTIHLMSRERVHAFSEGCINNLKSLKVVVHSVSQNEFGNNKLT